MARQFAFLSQSVHWGSELAVGLLPNGDGPEKKQVFCFGDGLLWRQREREGNT